MSAASETVAPNSSKSSRARGVPFSSPVSVVFVSPTPIVPRVTFPSALAASPASSSAVVSRPSLVVVSFSSRRKNLSTGTVAILACFPLRGRQLDASSSPSSRGRRSASRNFSVPFSVPVSVSVSCPSPKQLVGSNETLTPDVTPSDRPPPRPRRTGSSAGITLTRFPIPGGISAPSRRSAAASAKDVSVNVT